MTYHIKVIKGGKIALPAALRRELGIADGDMLSCDNEGGRIVVQSGHQLRDEIRARVRAGLKRPVSVASYLADKYAEADGE